MFQLSFWFTQSQDWSSDLALFTSGVKVNPNNVKLRNNLGMELKSAGRLEEAQHHYLVRSSLVTLSKIFMYTAIQMSMEIDPDYEDVYFNYGNLLSDAGKYEAAAV